MFKLYVMCWNYASNDNVIFRIITPAFKNCSCRTDVYGWSSFFRQNIDCRWQLHTFDIVIKILWHDGNAATLFIVSVPRIMYFRQMCVTWYIFLMPSYVRCFLVAVCIVQLLSFCLYLCCHGYVWFLINLLLFLTLYLYL